MDHCNWLQCAHPLHTGSSTRVLVYFAVFWLWWGLRRKGEERFGPLRLLSDAVDLLSVSLNLGQGDQFGGNCSGIWICVKSVVLGWLFDFEAQLLLSLDSECHTVCQWNDSAAI